MTTPKTSLPVSITNFWHPTKNIAVALISTTAGSGKRVWWQCDKGHEWESPVYNQAKKKENFCPVCNGQQVLEGYNDLSTLNPILASQWHPTKNGTLKPQQVTMGAKKKVWWQCEKGHEWQTPLYHRTKTNTPGCPYCSGRIATPGVNDLKTLYPSLSAEWHPTKNKELIPENFKPFSSKKIWWYKEECNHEWETTIANRVSGKNCPYCSKRILSPSQTSLGSEHPDLIKYWSSKNNYTAYEKSSGSNIPVLWVKECGHEFKRAIKDFIKNQNCVYCSGIKALPGFNDLFSIHPGLKKEWNFNKNQVNPEQLRPGSDFIAWWQCNKGHEWQTRVANRPRTNCPTCFISKNNSTSEEEIKQYIKTFFPNAESNRTIIKPHHLDIYIPEKKIAIEYNGIYWHSEAAGRDKNYHYTKYKNCKDKGIQLIQIWEDDWKRNPEQIKQMIAHKLGVTSGSIYARNTVVKELFLEEARTFLIKNHIQEFSMGSYYLGLFDKRDIEKLVAVLVLKKEAGTNGKTLNIIRYATSQNVVGGFTKLLSYAEKTYEPESFITFSDNTVSDGGLYENNGFISDKELAPDYTYLVKGERKHKFGYRLKRFSNDPELQYEPGLTERELAALNGLHRVWDAGKTRWVKNIFVKDSNDEKR